MPYNDTPLQPTAVAPSDAPRLTVPDSPDVAFQGFSGEAFSILERLRAHPHIEQYRKEKEDIRTYLKDPFERYRDDLVVNIILPNRLDLETERNVFSRLLKNDFGAGGCHHHLWMSFYRRRRTRLTDIQLAHTIRPEGLRIAVFAGKQAQHLFKQAHTRILNRPRAFVNLVNPLLSSGSYVFSYVGRTMERSDCTRALGDLPDELKSADGFAVHRTFPAAEVVRRGGRILQPVLETVADLWPVYRFLLS